MEARSRAGLHCDHKYSHRADESCFFPFRPEMENRIKFANQDKISAH